MIAVLAGLLLSGLAGAAMLAALPVRLQRWEWLALAPGLGSGVITLVAFAALTAGLPFSPVVRLLLAVATVATLVAPTAWQKGVGNVFRRPSPSLEGLEKDSRPLSATERTVSWILGILIAAAVLSSVLMALYWPPHAWDALSIWVLKARIIHETGELSRVADSAGLFYPLHVPLQLALLLPAVPLHAIQVIFPIYFLLLLMLLGGWARRYTHPGWALALCALVATTPTFLEQSSVAMADVVFAYYYVASVLMLVLFVEHRAVSYAALSGLLVGIACWTRADGLMYGLINLALLGGMCTVRPRSAAALATYSIGFLLFWWPWRAYLGTQGWGEHFLPTATTALSDLVRGDVHWDRLDVVLRYLERHWTRFGLWGTMWVAFGLSLVIPRAASRQSFLLAAIVLNLLGLVFTYYAYYRPDALGWALDTGFVRMATHFAPLLWVYAVLALSALGSQLKADS